MIDTNSLSSVSTRVAEIAATPDLIVSSLSASRTSVFPSNTSTLTATVWNVGTRPSAATTLRWYLSRDNTITTADTEVGTSPIGSLAAGASNTVSISIRLSNTLGTYPYGACVDPVEGEHYTNDNCSSALRILVTTHPRLPMSDFNTFRAAGNTEPRGIWSDGTTLWVSDRDDDKLYAYSISNKARLPAQDFDNLRAAGINDPYGIWSDGNTMWVVNNNISGRDRIYAYDLGTKARLPAKDFTTLDAAGNNSPSGLWSDGTTMWVADWGDDKLYAYDLVTKARLPANDFTLSAGNTAPGGIWSDGTTMWVADWHDKKLYAYSISNKARLPAKDFNAPITSGNTTGIWSDGATMWVADWHDDKLFAYDARLLVNSNSLRSVLTRVAEIAATPDLIVSMSASSTSVFLSNTTTLLATVWNRGDPAASSTLRWYLSTNSTLDTNTDISLGTSAISSLGAGETIILSNTIMITNPVGTYTYYGACADPVMDELYTNDNCSSTVGIFVSTHPRLPTSEFNTLRRAGNRDPRGIWSDGTTMWVADTSDDRLYAYDLATKAHESSLDFNTLSEAGNNNPTGLWSDGSTLWVADIGTDKIYAYDLATKARLPVKEFNTLSEPHAIETLAGIWSDGTNMWVADPSDDKLYAYDLATKEHATPMNDFPSRLRQ